MTIKIVNWL